MVISAHPCRFVVFGGERKGFYGTNGIDHPAGARQYVDKINAVVRTPITSVKFFADIIEEVTESAIPESNWERVAQRWRR